jgi:mRNA-degrading endonuclease toxin of MazEF toxin-antitoxin module
MKRLIGSVVGAVFLPNSAAMARPVTVLAPSEIDTTNDGCVVGPVTRSTANSRSKSVQDN